MINQQPINNNEQANELAEPELKLTKSGSFEDLGNDEAYTKSPGLEKVLSTGSDKFEEITKEEIQNSPNEIYA